MRIYMLIIIFKLKIIFIFINIIFIFISFIFFNFKNKFILYFLIICLKLMHKHQ